MRAIGSNTKVMESSQPWGWHRLKPGYQEAVTQEHLLFVNTYSFPDSLLKPSWKREMLLDAPFTPISILLNSFLSRRLNPDQPRLKSRSRQSSK